jgi:sirohydrochlorin cobalto/nickelchelatase
MQKFTEILRERPAAADIFSQNNYPKGCNVIYTWQKIHLVRIFKIPGNTICYMGKKGMLLVGHGSTMPYNKELVENTASFIKAKNTDFIVKCGFMNMNSPTIRDSLEEFRREPIDALVVVPLFLAKGVHIEKDIPGEIGLAEGTKKGIFALNGKSVPLFYADPIGSDPLLADLMVKNATKALTLL